MGGGGEYEYVLNLTTVTYLRIFTVLKHLMMLLKYNFFSGLNFYTLSKTLITCRGHAAQTFF